MSATGSISLKPLTTGELFDRAFRLFRQNWLLFTGIMSLPNLAWLAVVLAAPADADWGGLIALIPSWLLSALALGATAIVVSDLYAGCQITILQAYGRVKPLMLRLLGMQAVLGLATAAGLIFCWIPGIWVLVRTALSVPVVVLEDLHMNAAVARSIELTGARWVRVLLVDFLVLALTYAVSALLEFPFMFASEALGGEGQTATLLYAASEVGAAVASTLAESIGAIAVALIYFDERVRQEGLDLQYMMARLDDAPASGAGIAEAGPPTSPAGPPAKSEEQKS